MKWIKSVTDFLGMSTGGAVISSYTPTSLISSSNVEHISSTVVLHKGDVIQLETRDGRPVSIPMKVERAIEAGGFGTVFEVYMNNKVYALKVLALWLKLPKETADLVRRFESSYKAGQIASPFIINYYDKGYLKGNPCILMDFCPNKNLDERMEEFYPTSKWIDLGIKLLLALKDLHGNGVIHKDFKPKNILFSKDDIPKLTDFDFSAFLDKRNTITRGGRVLDLWYTAIYSPPEQIDPNLAYEKTGPAVDMFSFAVTMYQVISGRKLPWGSFEDYHADPEAYYNKIKSGNFVPITNYRTDIPADWAFNIHQCLLPKTEQRVQTPIQFLKSVQYEKYLSTANIIVEKQNDVNPKSDDNGLVDPLNGNGFEIIEVKAGTNNIGQQFNLGEILDENREDESIIIGRLAKCKIHVDAILPLEGVHHVSRNHATIRMRENKWEIRDGYTETKSSWKNSINGTEVYNSNRGVNSKVPNDKFIALYEGDIINLAGEVTLKFYSINHG